MSDIFTAEDFAYIGRAVADAYQYALKRHGATGIGKAIADLEASERPFYSGMEALRELSSDKRDQLAAVAMLGLIIATNTNPARAKILSESASAEGETPTQSLAGQAYELADAMQIKAREQKP